MGGRDTEIDDNTTTVLLESASFNLYNLRNTQMRHGIFSEAITRFTKGQPAELTAPVLAGAVDMLRLAAGAERASEVADTYPVKQEFPKVYAMAEHMNAALGTDYTTEDIVQTLQNVEFDVTTNDKGLVIAVPPYWRADIHISEDLDEEVGRLNGFDSIMPTLPKRDFTAIGPDNFDQTRTRIRQTLARAGANEVLTYTFVHGDLLRKAGQDLDNSYRIVNSISPDLQYYRQSVLPSLLHLVHPNIKAGYDEFALFELNKAHAKSDGLDDAGLPIERDFLAFVVARKKPQGGAAFYEAKRHLEFLAQELGLHITFEPAFENPKSANARPFDIRRSAAVKAGDVVLGIVGEFKRSVMKNFKLPEHAAGFVVSSTEVARLAARAGASYKPLSRFPSTERDICFQVSQSVSYAEVDQAAQQALSETNLDYEVNPLDIYQPERGDTKNVTLRIQLTPHDKTLTGDEIASVMTQLANTVSAKIGARVV
jgi:phenylalanyl-tRNA synthetase beta chain